MLRQTNPESMRALALIALVAWGCSTPIGPTVSPAVDLVVSSQRVEAGEDLHVTVNVRNAGVPLDELSYAWSASPAAGTFSGRGEEAIWRAPRGQNTPDIYTLSVLVTQRFPSTHAISERWVARASVPIHYNDSPAEVRALAAQFYQDFGTYFVTPEQCVRNFSDSCDGKQLELHQIEDNRVLRRIVSSTLTGVPLISFDNGRMTGSFLQRCSFLDTAAGSAERQRVTGDCYLTTVYENGRWFLCDSFFRNGFLDDASTAADLRLRVPGRVVLQ